MSAQTQRVTLPRKDGILASYPVLAAKNILSGAPVFLKSSGRYAFTNDGTTDTLANGDVFVGFSTEDRDNTLGSSGDKSIRAYKEGSFLLTFSDTLTQWSVGAPVYINNVSDNSVVTVTSDTGNPQVTIGEIVEFVSATQAYVKLTGLRVIAAAGA